MPVFRKAAALGSLGLLCWSGSAFIQAPHAWVRPLSQPGRSGESRPAQTQDGHTFSKVAARRSRLFADSDGASSPGQVPEVIFEPDVPYGDQQAEIEYFGDDELLEKYRQDRQKVNDQWQFNTFVDNQSGTWCGIWSDYMPARPIEEQEAEGTVDLKLVNTYKGRQVMVVDRETRVVQWQDEVLVRSPDGATTDPVIVDEQVFAPLSFRASNGAMAVDNAFTMAVNWTAEETGEDLFSSDTWLRYKDMRTRVRLIYSAPTSADPYRLNRLLVIREKQGTAGPTCEEPELFGPKGEGIYDRCNQGAGDWEVNFPGGVTLSFPSSIAREYNSTFIADWTAGEMRYQGDRTFERPDGSLSGFSVTQISTADSRVYLPDTSAPQSQAPPQALPRLDEGPQ